MTVAFVSIGSNIAPEENVKKAVLLLGGISPIKAISTVYLTEPVGGAGQPSYYNCMVKIESALPPLELKRDVLSRIEDELGRKRGADKYAPRTIDLDLILYGDLAVTSDDLTLPDPDIVQRPFLAIGVHELAPGLVLPGSNLSIQKAASPLPRGNMKPLDHYTERIRREILHDGKQ